MGKRLGGGYSEGAERRHTMSNVFYVIGVTVVAFAVLGWSPCSR
jgi:hypothetical protein